MFVLDEVYPENEIYPETNKDDSELAKNIYETYKEIYTTLQIKYQKEKNPGKILG